MGLRPHEQVQRRPTPGWESERRGHAESEVLAHQDSTAWGNQPPATAAASAATSGGAAPAGAAQRPRRSRTSAAPARPMRASWVLAALAALALAGNQRQGPRWTGIPSLVSAAAQSPDINSNLNLGTNATNSSDAPDEVPEISFSVEGAPGSGVVAVRARACGERAKCGGAVGARSLPRPTAAPGFLPAVLVVGGVSCSCWRSSGSISAAERHAFAHSPLTRARAVGRHGRRASLLPPAWFVRRAAYAVSSRTRSARCSASRRPATAASPWASPASRRAAPSICTAARV